MIALSGSFLSPIPGRKDCCTKPDHCTSCFAGVVAQVVGDFMLNHLSA